MIRTFTLLALATGMIACSRTVLADNSQELPVVENTMSSTTDVPIKNITLMAREEKQLPPGQMPTPDRDIGFASVFLRIENTKQENVNLVIQRIEICNASDGRVQMASHALQEIHLRPLENYENVFRLTNKTGYSGQDRVKAVVTYKIKAPVQVIESSPVEVNRL